MPKNKNRYAQLKQDERAIVSGKPNTPDINARLNSFLGTGEDAEEFKKNFERLRTRSKHIKSSEDWLQGFAIWANTSHGRSKRRFRTKADFLLGGVLAFLEQNSLSEVALRDLPSDWMHDFRRWLLVTPNKDGVEARSRGQARKQLASAIRLIKLLQNRRLISHHPIEPAPIKDRGENKTPALDDEVWAQIYKAATSEVLATMRQCEDAWKILDGPEIPPSKVRRGRGRFSDMSAAIWALRRSFPTGAIPTLDGIRSKDVDLGNAIQYIWKTDAVTIPFQPSPRAMLPFVVLLLVYLGGNSSPVKGLIVDNVNRMPGLGAERIGFYLVKDRGTNYPRTFALDDNDPLSPERVIKFVQRWTSRIRQSAGCFARYLFIFANKDAAVKPFSVSSMPGISTDLCLSWVFALRSFSRDWDIPAFGARELRQSGLDIVRAITNEDLLAVQAAGGQASPTTIRMHYESGAAVRRYSESLGLVMLTMPRYVASSGRIDPRASPSQEDILAATPGWHCFDPFKSPMPGQPEGKLCNAFGQCPACPNALLHMTPYSFARSIQLLKEITEALDYLDFNRWSCAYGPVKDSLEKFWLPEFEDEIVNSAKLLSLSPIGELD